MRSLLHTLLFSAVAACMLCACNGGKTEKKPKKHHMVNVLSVPFGPTEVTDQEDSLIQLCSKGDTAAYEHLVNIPHGPCSQGVYLPGKHLAISLCMAKKYHYRPAYYRAFKDFNYVFKGDFPAEIKPYVEKLLAEGAERGDKNCQVELTRMRAANKRQTTKIQQRFNNEVQKKLGRKR